MRKTKLLSVVLTAIIGGFIGLQSTVSSTVKAETETVPIFIRDTVTNTIIDKRIVVETDTVVRDRFVNIPVRDEIWAAKAVRLFEQPKIVGLPAPPKLDLSNKRVSID